MRAQLDKLAALLEEFDVDVVLVANPENVEYFTGVRSIAEPQALLVARRGGTVTLYTTLLDYYRYERLEGLGVEVRAVTSSARRPPDAKVFEGSWKELVSKLAEGSKVGLDAQYTSPLSAILAEGLGGRSVDVSKAIRNMRMIKEPWEVELIREAVRITSKAIEDAVEQVVEGVTEAELAGIFEASARKAGIDEFAFQSIVASKPSNSFPHVYPGLKR
ncbi:MAG: aminopeptidase P family N-terminal domain-containing protein, partial [Desulfurococcaceae archaeon]